MCACWARFNRVEAGQEYELFRLQPSPWWRMPVLNFDAGDYRDARAALRVSGDGVGFEDRSADARRDTKDDLCESRFAF